MEVRISATGSKQRLSRWRDRSGRVGLPSHATSGGPATGEVACWIAPLPATSRQRSAIDPSREGYKRWAFWSKKRKEHPWRCALPVGP